MRFVYTVLILVLAALVTIFAFQNLKTVTIGFLTVQATLPLALLVAGVYFLGLLTGGALIALVKSWIRGASRK